MFPASQVSLMIEKKLIFCQPQLSPCCFLTREL
jgi:hypothetical protein